MSFSGKLLHCSSLTVAVLMAMFVGSICLPTQSPMLAIDEGWSAPEAQDELTLKHVTNPSIQAPEFEHIGDMTVYHPLSDDQDEARERRNAVTNPRQLWPDGIVPYEIASSFSSRDRDVILRSMKHWEDNTCIRFRPKVSSDVYSIFLEQTPGCSSFVGRIPQFYQPQGVSLGRGCVFDSVVIHELGHAVGFYHEHTRPDRDDFVDVIYDNIRDGAESQFFKFQPGQTNTLGLGYDLQSIMHYRRNTFSKDGSDTIRAKDPSVTSFGNSRQLSSLDIAKANSLYNCPVAVQKCGTNFTTSSGTLQTPNWPQTYPVNTDCEWFITLPDSKATVEITCDEEPYGIAGGYPQCERDYLEIYDGHTNRDRKFGPYCEFTKPGVVKTTANLAKVVFHAGPSHSPSRRGLKCSFRSVSTLPPPPPTTLPPTPPPTIPPPCGGVLNTASGSFQTPNWPATYPVNVDCEWRIELPDARKLVELKCDHQPFGIAGGLPDCSLDYLKLYDGHDSTHDTSYGPFCHFTPPEILKMSSNLAMAVFHAGPSHSPSRRGFRCTFESVEVPTTLPPTPPPTIPPRPSCGGVLKTASGSFQTPNWPETYPNNIDCQWTIELPDASNLVELKCDHQPFGIAGGLPDCDRDYLKVYDGHSTQDTSYGPFCYFTPPDTLKMSSNKAMAVFHAGPSHSTSRKGFRCTFQSLPSSPPPPSTPQCGGVLTTPSGSFQTQNWPSTYPVNVDCQWTIRLPNTNRRVELIFENPFGIAGSLPDCEKDHLRIYDDRAGAVHGPYCYFTPPPRLTMSSSEARVVFHAGPAHSPSRVGFKANYRSA